MDETIENLDSSMEETTETQVVEVEEAPTQEEGETKQEYTEREKQYYARIKELEKKLKEQKNVETPQDSAVSPRDFLALKDANITADDFDEVQEFAKYKKISIADALANPTLKAILSDRAEERRTARATETHSPRGIAKTSGETLS